MKKGIVIEIKDGKATLLKNGGEFITIPAQSSWQKGSVVSIHSKQVYFKAVSALAACFAICFFAGSYFIHLNTLQTSLLSLDVNPSIDISLNQFDRVISVSAHNPEASDLLKQADLKNKRYADALEVILAKEEMLGYFNNNANVTFTVFSEDKEREKVLLEGLQATASKAILPHHQSVNMEYYTVDAKTVQDAQGYGITAGKYLYLQQLRDIAPELDIGNFTHHSIEQIKGKIEDCKNEHRPNSAGEELPEKHHN